MGNRCIITTQKEYCGDGFGLYLHWNGGRDSVEGFLTYCRLKNYRCDASYGLARLAQVVGNFFGGSLSLGIERARCGAGDDNGVYIIGDDWRIVRRMEFEGSEQAEYDLYDFVTDVNNAQPAAEQIDDRILSAMLLEESCPCSYSDKIKLCKPGTMIYTSGTFGDEKLQLFEILGFGDGVVNGHDMTGIPFYNFRHYGSRWSDPLPDADIETIRNNPNSYLTEGTRFYFA